MFGYVVNETCRAREGGVQRRISSIVPRRDRLGCTTRNTFSNEDASVYTYPREEFVAMLKLYTWLSLPVLLMAAIAVTAADRSFSTWSQYLGGADSS